jgi:hypothetical protein
MIQSRVPLAELLEDITSELRQIHKKAMAGRNPIMRFQECELEFAIDVEDKVEGGFHIWVVKLGGGVKRTESNTIKIKYSALSGPPGSSDIVAPVEGAKGSLKKPERKRRKA